MSARLLALAVIAAIIATSIAEKADDIAKIYENPLAHGFGNDIGW